ncbi:MAG: hypothetical protein GX491_20570 [Chloroflexi bacterium]|nr:hypothetical protein [Chloroflexota bacterium]
MLGPLLFAQRWLHREIQMVLLLLTRRPLIALGLFSLLFFPGVLLHELSHFAMAWLLRVRTGRFSLLPSLTEDGKLRLGYVETEEADLLREALIGSAPLLTGGAAVAYLGINHLGLLPAASALLQRDWPALWQALAALPSQADFWLWFYLAFTISSTMLPSASDRRAWLPLVLVLLALVGLALFAGAGPWMFDHLAPWLNRAVRSLATVFGISLALHLVMLIPLRLVRGFISGITGLRIVSQQG